MKLAAFNIGAKTYFCNELQIKEAGNLEAAAKAMHEAANPKPVKKEASGEKPNEK